MAKIVVGVDGSEGSKRALQWAIDEAVRRVAVVEVVHAVQLPVYASTPFGPAPIDPGNLEEAARLEVESVVAEADVAALAGPIVTTFSVDGAANALLAAATDADLLVVGSRGRGGFAGLLLGSVSQQVVHHARCPVVVVPPGA